MLRRVVTDTAFMYVLAVLSMVKIYQARHPDINARAHATFAVLAVLIALGTTPAPARPRTRPRPLLVNDSVSTVLVVFYKRKWKTITASYSFRLSSVGFRLYLYI